MKKKDLVISGRKIGDSHPCFVIAEIGQNHQGDIEIAKKLIQVAKDCGADCVKFQKSCLEEKFTQAVLNAAYSGPNSWGDTYGEHKRFLEFSQEEFIHLQNYASERSILFTASAMDPVSLKFLAQIQVPFVKIGSGDSDNISLIDKAAATNIPLVISTGMLDEEGVEEVYKTVQSRHDQFAFLHCVSSYPTPVEEANLKAISSLQKSYPVHIGYSGHEVGFNLTIAAVALGAKIVERHITLDKGMKGSDHCCSLDPRELGDMIRAIREVEKCLGDGVKRVMPCEEPCMAKLGKRLVFSRNLVSGETLQKGDIKVKVCRTSGLRPREFFATVGKELTQDAKEDDAVTNAHFL